MEAQTKADEAASIMFFTEADLDSKGKIKHTYPIYFNRKHTDDIREEINRLKKVE